MLPSAERAHRRAAKSWHRTIPTDSSEVSGLQLTFVGSAVLTEIRGRLVTGLRLAVQAPRSDIEPIHIGIDSVTNR